MTSITVKELKEKVFADQITKRNGLYTFRRGFFYRCGGNPEKFMNHIQSSLEEQGYVVTEIEDYGEVYKPFRGGAPVAQQSHWFVKLRLERKE